MGRLRFGVPVCLALLLLLAGCGGGGSSAVIQPPPPIPDFSLGLSSGSVAVNQGATSPALSITINPQNGFAGTVQVSLSGLPPGVTSNPASPFGIAAGSSVSVVFGVAANSATGTFSLSAQGTSGSLAHSDPLSLTIQPLHCLNLSERFITLAV